jgi:hypothetical protein
VKFYSCRAPQGVATRPWSPPRGSSREHRRRDDKWEWTRWSSAKPVHRERHPFRRRADGRPVGSLSSSGDVSCFRRPIRVYQPRLNAASRAVDEGRLELGKHHHAVAGWCSSRTPARRAGESSPCRARRTTSRGAPLPGWSRLTCRCRSSWLCRAPYAYRSSGCQRARSARFRSRRWRSERRRRRGRGAPEHAPKRRWPCPR